MLVLRVDEIVTECASCQTPLSVVPRRLPQTRQFGSSTSRLTYSRRRVLEVARDGAEALARLEDRSRPLPILVLLDLKLPRISGLEVLKRLRSDKRTRHVPVVVLTSSSEESDLYSSYDSGANAYVRKPVDFDRFTEIVRQLGLFWLVVNEVPPEANGDHGA